MKLLLTTALIAASLDQIFAQQGTGTDSTTTSAAGDAGASVDTNADDKPVEIEAEKEIKEARDCFTESPIFGD